MGSQLPVDGIPLKWLQMSLDLHTRYFLSLLTPCRLSSRSALSLSRACSPIASRRILSRQASQIPPRKSLAGLPQTIHFFSDSLIASSHQLTIFICLGSSRMTSSPYCG